jgi:integrase
MNRRERGDGTVVSYATSGGHTLWRCQWREAVDPMRPELGKKLHSKGGFATRDETRDVLRVNLARVTSGEAFVVAVDRLSFESYARRWLAGYSCEPTTRTYITRVIDALVPYIGAVPIGQLLPSDLAAAYRGLETGAKATPSPKSNSGGKLAASTLMRYSGWAVTIFNAALDEDLITRNPASHKLAGRPRGPRAKRVKPFAVWDAERAVMFCDWALATDQPWAIAWAILVRTGLRSGEFLALVWTDVDLRGATLLVERTLRYNASLPLGERYETALPKSGRSRRIALDATTVELFASWRRRLATATRTIRFGSGPVFPSIAGRAPHQSALLAVFKRTQSAFTDAHPDVHLPTLAVHELRHTHASQFGCGGRHQGHPGAAGTLQRNDHTQHVHPLDAERTPGRARPVRGAPGRRRGSGAGGVRGSGGCSGALAGAPHRLARTRSQRRRNRVPPHIYRV